MSASAIRRKSYKKAQEEACAPLPWEGGHGRGVEVPAGKLQVMEKFFTPVQPGKERRGDPDLALRSSHQQWSASRSDRFSTFSSSTSTTTSSASTSSASWSSEASFNKQAFLMTNPHSRPQHSQSCVDIAREPSAFRPSRDREAAYMAEDPSCSLARLRKGQSKSAERLPCGQGPRKAQSLPDQTNSIDRHLYKATGLERSLMFNEQAEILAPRQPHQMGVPGPSKGILKNGDVAGGDRLRKAKSIETITVRSVEEESLVSPGPGTPLQREKQPPSSLDLSAPKKFPNPERNKWVEQKLRFSQFLNEITQQVLSPSSLCSLGWKPRETALAGKTPSTDGSDSKGSSSKASSPGSLLDVAEGKRKEEKASCVGRRPMRPEAKGYAALSRSGRRQANLPPARSTDEASTSPEWDPAVPLTASLRSLPKQRGKGSGGPKKPRETKAGHGKDPEDQELPLKKAEEEASVIAEKPDTKDQQENLAGKARIFHKKLLEEMNTELPISPWEQQPASSAKKDEEEPKSGSSQRDLQKTWEELEALKEKFCRLQQDYSDTRQTNQLLEEKLQNIAQSMTEEKDVLNQRINELMDKLVTAQNTISSLEKINISGQQFKSGTGQQHDEKAESPDSFCSLRFLDVAPPPAFMDSIPDAPTAPSRSDSTSETSKLCGTCKSDIAALNGEEIPLLGYKTFTPLPEAPNRHRRDSTPVTAFTPWKRKATKFSVEHVSSTESECSGEEITPLCSLPTPRFLYLRQEALVAPSGPSSFPSLPSPEPVVFGLVRSASPLGLPPSGPVEPVPELSSSGSSEDSEVSWCPGLMEKASGSHLDYLAAQKMLDSLLHKSSERKGRQVKEPPKTGRAGGFHLAGSQEGRGSGQISGHQHRVHYYPVEELLEEKSYPCPRPGIESLPRGVKGESVGLESIHAAQDSTSF